MKLQELFFRDMTSLGGMFFSAILIVAFWTGGYQVAAVRLFFGIVVVVLAAILIRLLYFKQRPKKQKYKNLLEKVDASSFPSVHASRTWVMAIVTGAFFGNVLMWALTVLLACIVCYSRIYLKKHDWYDVLGGSVIGLLIGFLMVM